jgi:hypothetical protein
MSDGFSFTAPAGMSVLIPEEAEQFIKAIAQDGDEIEITVRRRSKPKREAQNNLFHTLVRAIAKQSGTTFECAKDHIKRVACDYGYPQVTDESGYPLCDDEGNPVPISVSKAGMKDMTVLIDVAYMIGDEYGYELDSSGRNLL